MLPSSPVHISVSVVTILKKQDSHPRIGLDVKTNDATTHIPKGYVKLYYLQDWGFPEESRASLPSMSDFDLREQENKTSLSFKINDIEYPIFKSIRFELLSK